jgi:EAL domain-containing protein (putative c-di-GMP-specific phosphodiesterase class I)/GGDEF domain-containing protein
MVAFVAAFGLAAVLLAAIAFLRVRALRDQLQRTEQARAAAERLEMFCPVTGLANRRRAAAWIASAAVGGRLPAAIAVALDSDRYGPIELAALADPVAQRLARLSGEHGLAARLGPDRYLLALAGAYDAAGVIDQAQAVRNALLPVLGSRPELRIGAALAERTGSAEALIADAERALAPVTTDDAGSIGVHGRDLERTLRHRAVEAKALAAAIAEGRIEPFYQPLVELGSGKVLGFEVLARWRDDDGRVRLPGEFVPLAEETGLVGEMYFALLRRAAAEVRRWPLEWGFTLNLSPRQFADDRLVERTVQTLLKAGVAPGRLELEISERALEQGFDGARRTIAAFRRRGVRIALDNFGNGRMPLCELARLEFDRLKVDRALLDTGEGRGQAFGVIAAAAHHLGVSVVVQHIETRDGADQAQRQGAAIGQGFLFGRPDPQTEYFRLEGSLARRIDDAA